MGWRLRINFSDGSSELLDDIFETEQDAEDEYQYGWLDSWNAGRETLELAGENFCDEDIVDCDIWEE